MLMVIFGAGASYDSVPTRRASNPNFSYPISSDGEFRPPLANQLFADRPLFREAMQRFPRCQPIIPLLQKAGVSVEQELEKLRAEARDYPERDRQLAAIRYYLHFVLRQCEDQWHQRVAKGITNYKSLLDQIEMYRKKEECVCLVTFNYDRMLEDALPSVGIVLNGLPDYIASERYKIIKPHGSVDWGREVETPVDVKSRTAWQVLEELIGRAAELQISQRFHRAPEFPTARMGGSALFPALAIPVQQKSEFECPAEHIEALRQRVTQTTKLLVIGWRATEFHFLELLKQYLPSKLDVLVVAGGGKGAATEISQRLQANRVGTAFREYDQGFTEFIENRAADEFLRA